MEGEELRVRYCGFMSEVKTRIQSIYDLMDIEETTVPFIIILESCYLQLRMIAELIAIASLSAHGDIIDNLTKDLSKAYSANKIIEAAELIHPNFYPNPVRQIKGDDGRVVEVIDREGEFLSREKLKSLYLECGEYLHRGRVKNVISAKNKVLDQDKILGWCQLIINLLDHHQIHMMEDGIMCLVGMKTGPEGRVQLAVLKKL